MAVQQEVCSSTMIWYTKGTTRLPNIAGTRRKATTGTLLLYSGIGKAQPFSIQSIQTFLFIQHIFTHIHLVYYY